MGTLTIVLNGHTHIFFLIIYQPAYTLTHTVTSIICNFSSMKLSCLYIHFILITLLIYHLLDTHVKYTILISFASASRVVFLPTLVYFKTFSTSCITIYTLHSSKVSSYT